MLEAATDALLNIFGCPCALGFVPLRLLYLLVGVLAGLSLGVFPGLGGLIGLSILLPLTFTMEPATSMAMIIGLLAVTVTGDTVTSVLLGTPGTAGSQATIMDGFPMAQRGEAGRALGAGYTASLIGGLFGAVVLGVSIPLLRPVVMAFGAPEFFMLGVMGISMVAALSGGAPLKGFIAAGLGLWFGMVGVDLQTGIQRWTFGEAYLWDGVPLVPMALGLFAIPEVVDLLVRGTSVAQKGSTAVSGVGRGVLDVLRNPFLVLRCSALGVWLGSVPGIGQSVVDWIAYGHAAQTIRGANKTFGKGDVRGVIAPESANNAKEGGALIPTIVFGVPGSASMALVLGAFMIQGITPGRAMLNENLDITYTIIWSLALANVFATGICLSLTPYLARIAHVPVRLLAPVIIAFVFLGAFADSRHLGDLLMLMAFAALGWTMKRLRWARPPLLLGLVLSPILENNFLIAMAAYGVSWMWSPLVLVIAAITALGAGSLMYSQRRGRLQAARDRAAS